MASCTYCGAYVAPENKDKIGASVHYVCGDRECNKQFCRAERDFEREQAEEAQYAAERDGYSRYF